MGETERNRLLVFAFKEVIISTPNVSCRHRRRCCSQASKSVGQQPQGEYAGF